MSLWNQQVFSSQLFFTDTTSLQYNFEILNYTSLNFARPGTPTDSHTAAMTAERRKLFDQLPRINTEVNNIKKCVSQEPQPQKNLPTVQLTQSPENVDNIKPKVTQSGARVKFANDVAAVPDDEENLNSRKKRNKLKALRRASAPAQGIEFYLKNAKSNKDNNVLSYFERQRQNNISSIDETPEDNNDKINHDHDHHHHHHHHHHHNDTNSTTSLVSPSDHPPSLSPCSSTSSLSSAVEVLSPETTNNQPFIPHDCNYWSIKSKSKTIPTDHYKTESHSFPDNVGTYDNLPWSPAVSFLSNLANSTVRKSLPDDEGQQVGEYIIGKVVGTGGFSVVKQAHTMDSYSNSMETVAVKIIKNHPGSEDNDRVQALLEREIAIWRNLNHENIVHMLSVEESDYATFIFSEYCPGGTLLNYIKKHRKREGKGIDEDEARNIFLEIAEALRYLHNDMRLVHKDVKLDNIILDKDDTWKMCDFGLTEFQNSANGYNTILFNSVGGSLAYCAPEQLRSPTPLKDPSVDVWSLAVVLFAMVTGQLPFSDDFEPRLQFKIINGRYDESLLDDSGVSDDLKDLLKGMFKSKPDQRLTISQVLEHRWCER